MKEGREPGRREGQGRVTLTAPRLRLHLDVEGAEDRSDTCLVSAAFLSPPPLGTATPTFGQSAPAPGVGTAGSSLSFGASSTPAQGFVGVGAFGKQPVCCQHDAPIPWIRSDQEDSRLLALGV